MYLLHVWGWKWARSWLWLKSYIISATDGFHCCQRLGLVAALLLASVFLFSQILKFCAIWQINECLIKSWTTEIMFYIVSFYRFQLFFRITHSDSELITDSSLIVRHVSLICHKNAVLQCLLTFYVVLLVLCMSLCHVVSLRIDATACAFVKTYFVLLACFALLWKLKEYTYMHTYIHKYIHTVYIHTYCMYLLPPVRALLLTAMLGVVMTSYLTDTEWQVRSNSRAVL